MVHRADAPTLSLGTRTQGRQPRAATPGPAPESPRHLAGDEVLRTVAATLRANTRSGDLVARSGGEEFIVLLPGVDSRVAVEIAEALRASIASQSWPHRLVTASFGVATESNSSEIADISGLFGAADRALYHSKETGRNRVTHATEGTATGVSPLRSPKNPAGTA